jgi:hypothetical protein
MNEPRSASTLLEFQAAVVEGRDPEHEVRTILEHVVAPERLPATRSLRLYHVRGVGNERAVGGEDRDVVVYGPEFLYVLDVGYPALLGVLLGMSVSGLGDPHFPDFSKYQIRSVSGYSPGEIIFPSVAGRLLIGVKEGTDERTVMSEIGPHVRSLRRLVLDIYLAEVTPFHEAVIGNQLEAGIPFIRYTSLDHINRIIDFEPGWMSDRVC